MRRPGAATSSPRCCARSTSPTSRSIPARAIAACTTASSTISATATPQMLLCLHEETRGRHRARLREGHRTSRWRRRVHSNVGLMHATMAIFNAWCDRVPIIVHRRDRPGGRRQAPAVDRLDSHLRRPGRASSATITKWDDQPASPAATREAIIARHLDRATPRRWARSTSTSTPRCRKRSSTEQMPPMPDVARFMPRRRRPARRRDWSTQAAALLKAAKNPVILVGRGSRSMEGWNERVALAETLDAGHDRPQDAPRAFPTDHPLHAGVAGRHAMTPEATAGRQGGRRHPRARLDRPRRRAARRLRLRRSETEDHQRQRGLPHPPRLEHGLRGAAADRRAAGDDVRAGRVRAARGARRRQGAEARRGQAEGRALQAERRPAAGRRSRAGAEVGLRRPRRHPHPPAAVVERRDLGFPPSARLHRLRRRRRHRRRPRTDGRRGARAARARTVWWSASAATATT